jgi:twinkle protein
MDANKGRAALENAIVNFPNLVPDNIDLSAFMDEEKIHRIKSADKYRDKLIELIEGKGESGLSTPWSCFNGNIEFRESEMTLWAGYKGHGKSVVVSQVLEHFMDKHSQKVFIISPEFPPHRVLYRTLIQSLKTRYPDREHLDLWIEAISDQLWIYDQQKSLSPRDIPALCRYAIKQFGVKHILIDSLMKCGISPEDYGAQKQLVDQIQQVAHNTGCHIHLIAHLRKGKSDEEIGGLHDVKGASEIADLCENVIVVWRNKNKEINHIENEPDAVIKVEAQRNGDGWIGKKCFMFDKLLMTMKEMV